METYRFKQSFFGEPVVRGSNSSNLAAPTLEFKRGIDPQTGLITIFVNFEVKGFASDFEFTVYSKSLFEAVDRRNIVISDVYKMYVKTVEDLRRYLDQRIGQDGISTIGVPMPEMEAVQEELLTFVKTLHA